MSKQMKSQLPKPGRKRELLATMKADPPQAYNQDDPSSVATLRRVDATGFIRLNALRLKVAAKVRGVK